MELLQETGYDEGIAEVQEEPAEDHLGAAHVQRMRPGTDVANRNLVTRDGQEAKGGRAGRVFPSRLKHSYAQSSGRSELIPLQCNLSCLECFSGKNTSLEMLRGVGIQFFCTSGTVSDAPSPKSNTPRA